MMRAETVIKSSQEQAVASWIDHLNQLRLDELIEKLNVQGDNLKNALSNLQKIRDFVANPKNILGSGATKHGEIAESVQVNISNARRVIEGLKDEYTFDGVGRLAPEDYLKNGAPVQSKFYSGGGNRTFDAICEHLKTYPDFIKNGGTYDIPKDQYEHIADILNKKPSLLSRSEATLVKKIREWEQENRISFTDKVKPAVADYADVQMGTVNETVNREEATIKKKDSEIRERTYENSKPSFKEGTKATAASAAVEGGMAFCLKVAEKLKSGKKIYEFTKDDWEDVGLSTAKGTGTGALRGAAIYVMTNFTATPAAVASAFVTAAVGTVSQAYKYRTGQITEEDFIINSQVLTLEAAISAISSVLGQVAIPIPVLGAVIGNTIGSFLYGIVNDNCGKEEIRIIDDYNKSMSSLTRYLDKRYKHLITMLDEEFKKFSSIVEFAFDEDVNKAFAASVQLAEYAGVDEKKILRSKNDIDNFFMS